MPDWKEKQEHEVPTKLTRSRCLLTPRPGQGGQMAECPRESRNLRAEEAHILEAGDKGLQVS